MTPMFKVSAAAMAAVGAKTAEEFENKLVALLTSCSGLSAAHDALKTKFDATEKLAGELKADLAKANETIAAQAGKITTLETAIGNPNAMTEAKIKDIATQAATIAGSAEAVKAVAASGNGAPPAPPANNGSNAVTGVAALIAAGKYEEAFAADKNIQAEFITAKGYAAYMRAHTKGQIQEPRTRK